MYGAVQVLPLGQHRLADKSLPPAAMTLCWLLRSSEARLGRRVGLRLTTQTGPGILGPAALAWFFMPHPHPQEWILMPCPRQAAAWPVPARNSAKEHTRGAHHSRQQVIGVE